MHAIAPSDLKIWTLTDEIDEVVRIVEAGVQAQTQERLTKTGRARKTADDMLQQATQPMAGTEQ